MYYKFWVQVSNLNYPRAKYMSLLHCHLWPVRLHHIFPHYLTNGTIFGKVLYIKRVFLFPLQLLPEKFFIRRVIQRDTVINVKCIPANYLIFFSDFNEFWIFSNYFRKINIKFHENPSSGGRVVSMRTDRRTYRQTNGYDKPNSRFSQFCERA